jgi:hypothetical protein
MLANRKNPDEGPTYRERHARRMQKDALIMDSGTGTISQTYSGHGYTSVSYEHERSIRKKFPHKFKNVKRIVDTVGIKPIKTIPEQTAALDRVTQLLQKASELHKKRSRV